MIDVTFYFRGYVGMFCVILNILSDKLKAPFARAFTYFPLCLAVVDLMEDTLQVYFVLTFDKNFASDEWMACVMVCNRSPPPNNPLLPRNTGTGHFPGGRLNF